MYSDDFNGGTNLSSSLHYENEFFIWHVSLIGEIDAGFAYYTYMYKENLIKKVI